MQTGAVSDLDFGQAEFPKSKVSDRIVSMSQMLTAPILEEVACPLCECNEARTIVTTKEDYYGGVAGTYSVSRCQACRHMYMNPRPTAETLHLCYPDSYGPHLTAPPRFQTDESTPPAETPWYLKYLPLRYVPGLKSFYYWLTGDLGQPLPRMPVTCAAGDCPRAVELGCATGSYLSKLVAAGWDVVGVEPSEAASAMARAGGFDVRSGTLDQTTLAPESFDSAAAWQVIEHVIDPVGTLKQFHTLLKPKGQLLLSIPNAGCWEPVVFRSAWYLWELPRHLHHFTPTKICETLHAAGFINVRVVHQRNVLNLIGSLGLLLSRMKATRGIGNQLLRYTDSPSMWVQLALSPLAHLLAACRQGGRLTVYAERP